MATEATTQVLDTSIDYDGLSVVTTTKTADNPRLGAVYNPLTLAGAVPVFFHGTQDKRYVMLMAKRWYSATMGTTGGPQSYSAHSETTTPGWCLVDPKTGAATTPFDLPTNLSGARVLSGATNRVDYLFTSGTVDGVPHVALFRMTANGCVVCNGEELIPQTNGVNFGAGCYVDGDFLTLIGVDVDFKVYLARKNWGRIGTNVDRNWTWLYRSAGGWSADPADLVALPGVLAPGGVVSYGNWRDREFLCAAGGVGASVYTSRRVESSWKLINTITADAVFLQNQLHYNPVALPDGVTGGIPYVKTNVDTSVGAQSLVVTWGLQGV